MNITPTEIVELVKDTAFYVEPRDEKLVHVNLAGLLHNLTEREKCTDANCSQLETLVRQLPPIEDIGLFIGHIMNLTDEYGKVPMRTGTTELERRAMLWIAHKIYDDYTIQRR